MVQVLMEGEQVEHKPVIVACNETLPPAATVAADGETVTTTRLASKPPPPQPFRNISSPTEKAPKARQKCIEILSF
jgi:hypothetical protein